MITAIVGLGWGDEGKGKIAHIESQNNDVVVRYNGGANAGHTICLDDDIFKLHHIPAGAVASNEPDLVLTHGVVINPVSMVEEIRQLRRSNIDIADRLRISDRAHCVMPWHIAADVRKGGKIGTTKKGIGPCYADKMHRSNAIRMGDLRKKLDDERTQRFFAVDETFHGQGLWQQYKEAAEFLQPMIFDTGQLLRNAVGSGLNILFEGANGILLDVDFGTFPYCTSSGVGPAAIPQSCGLPNLHLDRIIGIIKCYATRVGEGPFPSEIITPEDEQLLSTCMSESSWFKHTNRPYPIAAKEMSHLIREKGNEYGTTTGRPRRIGWLDLGLTRESVALTGTTEIALMHADTLAGIEGIKMYDDGSLIDIPSYDLDDDIHFRTHFVGKVNAYCGPVSMYSYGPDASEVCLL